MARYSTDFAEEEFPNVLPDPSTLSKRWTWNSDTGSLEQVSTGVNLGDKNAINLSKRQKAKAASNVRFSDRQKMTPKIPRMNTNILCSKMKSMTSPTNKINRNENRPITLADVKHVAYDLLLDEFPEMPQPFKDCYGTEQFESFLMTLLYYFEAYFELQNLENKPKPMATEPSAAEKLVISSAVGKQTAAQKLLAGKYCTLILGLGTQEQHHMACGKQRKSYTKRDRSLYETLYTFSSYVVWISFKRKDIQVIVQEIGRQFRSDAFNPAARPVYNNDFKLASDLTKQEDPDFNLAPYSVRQRQKRPAIKSIVNQRSPVLVSLLPTSKEASPWLLDRRKGLIRALGEIDDLEDVSASLPLKIGIIGEAINGFNRITLAPFGDEHDEGDASQRRFSSALSGEEKEEDNQPNQETSVATNEEP